MISSRLALFSTLALLAIQATPAIAHSRDVNRYAALAGHVTDSALVEARDFLEERDNNDDDEDCEDDEDVARKITNKQAVTKQDKKPSKKVQKKPKSTSSSTQPAFSPVPTSTTVISIPAPSAYKAQDQQKAAVVNANSASFTFAPSFAVVGVAAAAGAFLL